MYGPIPTRAYMESALDSTAEETTRTLTDLREELGSVPTTEEQGLELALIAEYRPVDLNMACLQTVIEHNGLLEDQNGANVERADKRYNARLELNTLDFNGELQSLREKQIEAREAQELAEGRLAALRPDKDLADSVYRVQQNLAAGRRRLTMGISTLAIAGLGLFGAFKTDNVKAEEIGAFVAAGSTLGVAIGRGVSEDFTPDWAHSIAKKRLAESKAYTVALKPYVR